MLIMVDLCSSLSRAAEAMTGSEAKTLSQSPKAFLEVRMMGRPAS